MGFEISDKRVNGVDYVIVLVGWDTVEEILGRAYADRSGECAAILAAFAGELPAWAAGATARDVRVDERWGLYLLGPALEGEQEEGARVRAA